MDSNVIDNVLITYVSYGVMTSGKPEVIKAVAAIFNQSDVVRYSHGRPLVHLSGPFDEEAVTCVFS